MTRLIIVTPDLLLSYELDQPADELVAAIAEGRWQPPAPFGPDLLVLLRVVRLGTTVLAWPAALEDLPALAPPAEGLTRIQLSPRQQQVLDGMAAGLSNRQIATQLGLNERTVDLHVAALKRRLHTTSRVQTVYRALALGHCRMKKKEPSQ